MNKHHKVLLIFILCIVSLTSVHAQDPPYLYLGLQPEFTIEPDYSKGEFDINAFPVVLQAGFGDITGFRLSTSMNIHVKNGTELSHLGAQFAVPFYPLHKSEYNIKGLYIAPVTGFSHNFSTTNNEATFAIEPGFSWLVQGQLSMIMGMQAGATFIGGDNAFSGWRSHFGIKLSLGYTF